MTCFCFAADRKVKINRETAEAVSAGDSEETTHEDMLLYIVVPLLSSLLLTSIIILLVCLLRVRRYVHVYL